MILLLACTGETPGEAESPAETATESPPIHSGETVPDSEVDSPPETADPETGESDATPADWAAGEDIPGWEDYDCTETAGARAYETRFPTMTAFAGEFLAGLPNDGPHGVSVFLQDCLRFRCLNDDLSRQQYELFTLDGTYGASSEPRGLGWWGPNDLDPRHAAGEGNGPLEAWSSVPEADRSPASLTVCISRFRPDRVEGVARVEIAAVDSGVHLVGLYDSVIYRLPFSVELVPRSGFDAALPDAPRRVPKGFPVAHITYDGNYDEAWPWEDITDPGIREAVYQRYRPYNW